MQAIERLVKIAAAEVGVKEVPRNRGPRVEEYLRSAGVPPGEPWCMAFVFWCFQRAAIEGYPRSGYCPDVWEWARRNGVLVDGRQGKPRSGAPARGDVMLLMDAEGRMGAFHTGIVERANGDGTVTTIEGNTGPDGGADGDGVYQKRRPIWKCDFVRWSGVLDAGMPEPKPAPPVELATVKAYFHPGPDGEQLATVDLSGFPGIPGGKIRVSGPVWGKRREGRDGDFAAQRDEETILRFRINHKED